MGLLRRLVGASNERALVYRWASSGIATDSDGVSWIASSSPDGRWAILTRDADDGDRHIGYRSSGPGRYRLVEGSVTRSEGRLQRPNDAKVANNGTFLIADWLFTDELACQLCIFDRTGASIVDEKLGANMLLTCLTDDGRYAGVHLANNPDDHDSDGLVTVWDLRVPARLWSKALEGGRANEMAIDAVAHVLRTKSDRLDWLEYDLETGATDVRRIREAIIRDGSGFDILELVADEVSAGQLGPDRAQVLIASCESAASKLREYPRYQARAMRMAGEIAEGQGDTDATLAYWDRALAADPKVGVAMRAKVLRASR